MSAVCVRPSHGLADAQRAVGALLSLVDGALDAEAIVLRESRLPARTELGRLVTVATSVRGLICRVVEALRGEGPYEPDRAPRLSRALFAEGGDCERLRSAFAGSHSHVAVRAAASVPMNGVRAV